jgi:hypothetical protein
MLCALKTLQIGERPSYPRRLNCRFRGQYALTIYTSRAQIRQVLSDFVLVTTHLLPPAPAAVLERREGPWKLGQRLGLHGTSGCKRLRRRQYPRGILGRGGLEEFDLNKAAFRLPTFRIGFRPNRPAAALRASPDFYNQIKVILPVSGSS